MLSVSQLAAARVAEIFDMEYKEEERKREVGSAKLFDAGTRFYLQPRGQITTSVKVQLGGMIDLSQVILSDY